MNNIKKAEYKLKQGKDKVRKEKLICEQATSTCTGYMDLSGLSTGDYTFELKVEDEDKNKYEVKDDIPIVIQ